MKLNRFLLLSAFLVLVLWGCADTQSHSRGVYMLMDTSGTYAVQLNQARSIITYLLSHLQAGDSLAVARIDSGSFSETDIVGTVTFDARPSVANQQKLAFKGTVDRFIENTRKSPYTDIRGGLLQAVEYLDETRAAHKTILIFSDLEEDLADGYVRNLDRLSLDLSGYRVVALNVTKLGSDQIDPQRYFDRLNTWAGIVESRGGSWIKINDLGRLDRLLNQP